MAIRLGLNSIFESYSLYRTSLLLTSMLYWSYTDGRSAGRPGLSGTKTISAQAGAGTGLSLAIVYGSEVQKDCLFVELSVLVRARRPKLKQTKDFLLG